MRYRQNSKIKRKHGLIDELEDFLRLAEQWPEVSAINPGIIKLCSHNDRLKIKISSILQSGIKCAAKSHGAVQEIFIVTSSLNELKKHLSDYIANND